MPVLALPVTRSVVLSRTESTEFLTYWLDESLDTRFTASATNGSTSTLHDHILEIPIPSGASIDTDSLRVVETTTINTVDKAYDWRYGVAGTTTANRFWYLPAYVSGSTLYVKMLGAWDADEVRSVGVYWDSTGTVSATTYQHLSGIAQSWNVAITAGTTGDHYIIVAGGETYDHEMTAGQTAAQIATALRALINAGGVATSGGSSANVTVIQTSTLDGTFAVTVSTSTVPGNLVVTKPNHFGIGRVGPDTEVFTSNGYMIGLPFHNPSSGAMTRPGFARSSSQLPGRLMAYNVNGVGAQSPSGATVTSVVNNGPTLSIAGALTWSRSEWDCTYTGTHRHVIYSGRKSDETNAGGVLKSVDVFRVTLTYECATAYTPAAVSGSATTLGSHELIAVASTNNTFGGNVTEDAGNKIANFYAGATAGAVTAYTSSDSATLTGLTVTDTIIGTHGNTNGIGLLVDSISLTDFGSQSPEAKWVTQGNAFGILHLRNLSNAAQIPQGATVTITAWIVAGYTFAATTVGDNFLPDEVVDLIRSLSATPSVTVGAVETYAASSLEATIDAAGATNLEAIDWFQDNAVAMTTVAGNGGYAYDIGRALSGTSDDDDGTYGEAFKLAGLCLRYLRTHDSSLIPMIETQVQYHIDIEQAAVTAYGSWWEGSAPYWYWPAVANSSGLTTEGGISGGDADPGMPGGVKGTINYVQGEVRRLTSIDQMHMVGIGLYHYLYLLRNESAITANTTLRTDALALLNRMDTFETAHFVASARVLDNLNDICNSITPTHANGINDTEFNDESASALANPYWGANDSFKEWQIDNDNDNIVNASANNACDAFFRALYAPGSTVAGVTRYMQGVANDMTTTDISHHDITFTTASWNAKFNSSTFPAYPRGWMLRSGATSNVFRWTSGRTGDDHFINIAGGVRDSMSGRAGQRLIALCIAYLLDNTYDIPVEMNSTTPLRSVDLRDEIDATALTLALYQPEPTTSAMRMSAVGWLGEPSTSYDTLRVDSASTGYAMMAFELWHLVNAGASYTTYYPIGSW